MKKALKLKLERMAVYLVDRLKESSTIQGLSAVVTLVGGVAYDDTKLAAWAFIAAASSAVIKIFLPDSWDK